MLEKTPQVSVVMNGFNSSRYLREAIDSLIKQSFEDWEMIFWDNCSEDETESIVNSYNDKRFKFYTAPRIMTLAEGRNEAVKQTNAPWVAFLDCDDIWLPNKLEEQWKYINSDPDPNSLGTVYCRARAFSSRGDEGECNYRYTGKPLPEGKILNNLLNEGNLILPVTAMVSRKAWDKVGGIPIQYRFAEDYYLFCAIAEKYRIGCVQESLCNYRVHPESATATMKKVSHQEALDVLKVWEHAMTETEYKNRTQVYQTLLGIEEIRREHLWIQGLKRILIKGSLFFLFRGMTSYLYRRFVKKQSPISE